MKMLMCMVELVTRSLYKTHTNYESVNGQFSILMDPYISVANEFD